MAKAPSLWKDGNKGTQRTRKLSTGNALWSWRNGILMCQHFSGQEISLVFKACS